MSPAAAADPFPYPGTVTDVAGLRVGHAAMAGRPTGCTVLLCPEGAAAGVAQRGGAPGTRETDLLRPENAVPVVHALLLSGGSAFGLAAADGVVRWLAAQGHGLPVGPACVPIVPAAVLFDLWLGDPHIHPDAACGEAACLAALHAAATHAAPAQGSHGAGLGASVGKLFGIGRAMKGGVGCASLRVGGVTVAALVAVNAVGDVIAANGQVLAGARTADGSSRLGSTAALQAGQRPGLAMAAPAGSATTIGVIATDAALSKLQAHQLAALAYHGLPRAIDPLVPHDGDTLFALATGRSGADAPDLTTLGALGAEVVARAIRNAIWFAEPLSGHALPSMHSLPP
jgi:L-aminopeptidase/D-esterase-like protein